MSSAPSPLTRSHFRYLERLRVRWAEVDMQQIVFNGHYLMYFDTALAGYWRALALPYQASMAALAGDFYVRKATIEYEGSARYDDQIDVGIRCSRIGSSSLLLQAAVFRGELRLVHADLVYVFADPASQTAKPVPAALREMMVGFESGEAMVTVRTGDWSTLGDAASRIRDAVFHREQGIAAQLGHDAADASALHAVAFNRLGEALGTGRMTKLDPGVTQLGRIAVIATLRGAGIGRALLDALVDAARNRGDHLVLLHAQTGAVDFYRHAGFSPRGAAFEEAGIAHQEMTLSLR